MAMTNAEIYCFTWKYIGGVYHAKNEDGNPLCGAYPTNLRSSDVKPRGYRPCKRCFRDLWDHLIKE